MNGAPGRELIANPPDRDDFTASELGGKENLNMGFPGSI